MLTKHIQTLVSEATQATAIKENRAGRCFSFFPPPPQQKNRRAAFWLPYLEQSDTASAVNWEIHAKEEMMFLQVSSLGVSHRVQPHKNPVKALCASTTSTQESAVAYSNLDLRQKGVANLERPCREGTLRPGKGVEPSTPCASASRLAVRKDNEYFANKAYSTGPRQRRHSNKHAGLQPLPNMELVLLQQTLSNWSTCTSRRLE